jgi:hypothetical protein
MCRAPKSGCKSIMSAGGMTIFGSLHHVQKQFMKISLQYTICRSSEVALQIILGTITMLPHSYCLNYIKGSNLVPQFIEDYTVNLVRVRSFVKTLFKFIESVPGIIFLTENTYFFGLAYALIQKA